MRRCLSQCSHFRQLPSEWNADGPRLCVAVHCSGLLPVACRSLGSCSLSDIMADYLHVHGPFVGSWSGLPVPEFGNMKGPLVVRSEADVAQSHEDLWCITSDGGKGRVTLRRGWENLEGQRPWGPGCHSVQAADQEQGTDLGTSSCGAELPVLGPSVHLVGEGDASCSYFRRYCWVGKLRLRMDVTHG